MDEDTKHRILGGDLDAYATVVRDYQNMVKGYALRRLGDWTLAEDVVHLTFVRAYQQLEKFRPDEDFGVWLCVTCKYLILTELEKQTREARNRENYRLALDLEMANAKVGDTEKDFKQDRADSLRECIEGLEDSNASLIQQRYFNRMSCKEIASTQKRTVTWVTSTLSRARKALRICLEKSGTPISDEFSPKNS